MSTGTHGAEVRPIDKRALLALGCADGADGAVERFLNMFSSICLRSASGMPVEMERFPPLTSGGTAACARAGIRLARDRTTKLQQWRASGPAQRGAHQRLHLSAIRWRPCTPAGTHGASQKSAGPLCPPASALTWTYGCATCSLTTVTRDVADTTMSHSMQKLASRLRRYSELLASAPAYLTSPRIPSGRSESSGISRLLPKTECKSRLEPFSGEKNGC